MSELISVIIPTYQHASVLSKTLDSVLAQTYDNIEIIVIDDGSTDETKNVANKYKEKIFYHYQDNQGANHARNKGFELSNGEFVIFCDADIEMRPEMLEKMYNILKNSQAGYAYSGFYFGWKKFPAVPFDANLLKKQNFIHTTSLIKRNAFPGFDIKIRRFQDWDLWLTMLEQGYKGELVNDILFKVKIHGKSRIGSKWLPAFMYKIPWEMFGFTPKKIREYENARKIILKKHNI